MLINLPKMRFVLAIAFLTVLMGSALACEYKEKQSPCCDEGVPSNDDVYLFTYYAWAVSRTISWTFNKLIRQ